MVSQNLAQSLDVLGAMERLNKERPIDFARPAGTGVVHEMKDCENN
jgi:hypothetical protein